MVLESDEEVTEQTAGRDLRQLVDIGLLLPHGEKRGRYYSRGKPLAELRQKIIDARDPKDVSEPFGDQ